jgi:hypothetical protein
MHGLHPLKAEDVEELYVPQGTGSCLPGQTARQEVPPSPWAKASRFGFAEVGPSDFQTTSARALANTSAAPLAAAARSSSVQPAAANFCACVVQYHCSPGSP